MYVRKAKAEKDCKNMARQLKAQKAKSLGEKANVVERMRAVFEREKDVAVSDATLVLKGDLRKSNRGVECLKHTLGKSEVRIFFITLVLRSPRRFYLFSSRLIVCRCKTIY